MSETFEQIFFYFIIKYNKNVNFFSSCNDVHDGILLVEHQKGHKIAYSWLERLLIWDGKIAYLGMRPIEGVVDSLGIIDLEDVGSYHVTLLRHHVEQLLQMLQALVEVEVE